MMLLSFQDSIIKTNWISEFICSRIFKLLNISAL